VAVCISDSEQSGVGGSSMQQPLGVEARAEVDHLTDGDAIQSGKSQLTDGRDDSRRSGDVREDGRRSGDVREDGRRSGDVRDDGRRSRDVREDGRRSGDSERTQFRGKDAEDDRGEVPTPMYDGSSRNLDDRFETDGDLATGGLRDGERHRTRRKDAVSWAEDAADRPSPPAAEADRRKTYAVFEAGGSDRGTVKDEARGASQYSRQDRRKYHNRLC